MSQKLTKTQKNILEFLTDKKNGGKIPPTLAEIAHHFGYRNRATVQQHLSALEKKGYVKRDPRIARGIEITAAEELFMSRVVLGEVAAGSPLTIYPAEIDTVHLPLIAKMPADSFLLRVKGDSLKDAYIFEGDIIIVNPNLEPLNGQIVVAILEDAAVVKRYLKKADHIELHSENPEYQPILVNADTRFKIAGVVIGVYRSLDKRIN